MNDTMTETMAEIRELARTRRHPLPPDMLGEGRRPLTPVQARLVLSKLRGCPPLEDAAPEPAPPASHEPAMPPRLAEFRGTPAGYYATRKTPGSDVIDYWLIEDGKGKWEGFSFARRVLGGLPADRKLRSVKITNMEQRLALQAITEAGLEDSRNLFADTLERCTKCSIPLTDPDSRAARMGPDCRRKHR